MTSCLLYSLLDKNMNYDKTDYRESDPNVYFPILLDLATFMWLFMSLVSEINDINI